MTLADALLVSTLAGCFESVLDKKTRDQQLQNLARYTHLILKMAPCAKVFGEVTFCKNVMQPNFNAEKPKKEAAPKQDQQKGQKKDKGAQQQQQQKQEKKGKVAQEAKPKAEAAKEEQPKAEAAQEAEAPKQ